MRITATLCLFLALLPTAAPSLQAQAKPAPSLPKDSNGVPLTAVTSFSNSVTVDAVLLPYVVSERLFGHEIAKRFVAVQVTISNRDTSSGLILHSIFLDYSQWLFSGNFTANNLLPQTVKAPSYQQQNTPSQVGSVNSKLVRGALEDAQSGTLRNWFIRAATLAGTGASAFAFGTTDATVLSSIGAYGNQIVPALSVFWPDRTPAQINRITDFGFQNNHVIPKNSSDSIVAFFPIDRFLTTNLKQIYYKNPAAFFVPTELLLDQKDRAVLVTPLQSAGLLSTNTQEAIAGITKAMSDYQRCKAKPETLPADHTVVATGDGIDKAVTQDDCFNVMSGIMAKAGSGASGGSELLIIQMLSHVSLNNIRVMIGGVMTVDVDTIPAVAQKLTFDSKATWTKSDTEQTATLTGQYLSGGDIKLTDSKSSFTIGSVDRKSSSDAKLVFTYKLAADVTNCDPITVSVSKTAQDGSSTVGVPLVVVVPTSATPCPAAPQ